MSSVAAWCTAKRQDGRVFSEVVRAVSTTASVTATAAPGKRSSTDATSRCLLFFLLRLPAYTQPPPLPAAAPALWPTRDSGEMAVDILMSTISAAIGVALQRQWGDGSGYIDVYSLCCYWSCPAARDGSGYIDVYSLCCYWSCPAARDSGETAVDRYTSLHSLLMPRQQTRVLLLLWLGSSTPLTSTRSCR